MESDKLTTGLTITMIVLMAFTSSGTMAQDFGAAPAPSPSMESAGTTSFQVQIGTRPSQVSRSKGKRAYFHSLPQIRSGWSLQVLVHSLPQIAAAGTTAAGIAAAGTTA
ncbi:hypothetical protein L6452_14103 [Arctium lappa]|uniref:Uncharacterized protein n=1 Tax=Arctium lappa TaxID=4217 RepID=A0ACB9CKB4_ARCLA|nr:hypothetical protein L6452_14103 [Arctium lappa]